MTEHTYEMDSLDTIIVQLAAMQKQINEMHAFTVQLAATMEQFQAGGMGKMIASMMGGKRG